MLDTVHTLLSHVMMRHSKTQTLHGRPILDLPPRTVRTVTLTEMEPSQRYVYEWLERDARRDAVRTLRSEAGLDTSRTLLATLNRLLAVLSHTQNLDVHDVERRCVTERHAEQERARAQQFSTAASITFDRAQFLLRMFNGNLLAAIRAGGFSRDDEQGLISRLCPQVWSVVHFGIGMSFDV